MRGVQGAGHPELVKHAGGVVLSVHVQPGAKRAGVGGRHGDSLKIRVCERAVNNMANEALVEFVATSFGLRASAVRLLSGASGRNKRLYLEGVEFATAAAVVDRLLDRTACFGNG